MGGAEAGEPHLGMPAAPARRVRRAPRRLRAVPLLGLALAALELASGAGVALLAYPKPDAFYRASVVDRETYAWA